MNHKGLNYKLVVAGIIMAVALASMLYIDRVRAEDGPAVISADSVLYSGTYSDTAATQEAAYNSDLAYVTQETNELIVIDRISHTIIDQIDIQSMGCYGPWRPRITPSGRSLYVLCSGSSNLIALQLPDLTLDYSLSYSGGQEDDILFTSDEDFAFISSRNERNIQVLDIGAQSIIADIPLDADSVITSMEASPIGSEIYAAGTSSGSGKIYVINTQTYEVVSTINFGSDVWDVITSIDGQKLYASDRWGAGIAIINAFTYEITDVIPNTGELTGLALSPDEETIFAGREAYGSVDVYEIESHSFIAVIWLGGTVRDLTTDCARQELYVAPSTYQVSVINTETRNVDFVIPTPGASYGVAICPQYMANPIVLNPNTQSAYARAGEAHTYDFQLTNLTGEIDSFNLEVLPGNAFTTTLYDTQVGPIEDNGVASFSVLVEVPPDAQPGVTDAATIQATSVSSPSLTATAMLYTTVLSEETAYVTLEDSNLIAVVDVTTQVIVDTIETGQAGCYNPWRATMSPDGAYVYFGCYNSGSVLVVETATNSIVTNIPNIPSADDVAFTLSGAYALVGSRWSNQIAVVNTATYNIIQYIYTNGYTRSLAMHPYRELIYATSGSGEILAIDTSTFSIIASIYVGNNPWDVSVSPDGLWVYAGDRWGSGVWVIDAISNSLYTTIGGMGEITGLEASNDGAYIYAGGLYYEVWVIDASTLSVITSIPINGPAWEMALTGDGTQLYVGNTTNEVAVIDTINFTVSGYIPMPGSTTRGIAIHPEYMAAGAFLIPLEQEKDGGRGESVVYQETLFNNSGGSETFDLQVTGFVWDTQLSTDQIGPIEDGESADFTVSVVVPTDAPWYDTDSATIMAMGVTSPALSAEAQIITTAFAPAQISVTPESLESTQLVGEVTTQTMTISNGPGVTLTYQIAIGGGEGAALELVLESLNDGYQSVTDLIPNRFDFDEGYEGCWIMDGGNDMYDGGNYLNTSLGGTICYSDNVILPESRFGESGRYFTRKVQGLFVLAADMQNVDFFQISGNLGADGGGNADGTVLQTEVNGVTYYGFVKRVYNAGDPSVNHLIIVAENPAAWHEFSTYTDDDFHQVNSLGTNTRLYYLLYAGANGYYIDDNATLEIMNAFLRLPGMSGKADWLTVDPLSGEIPTNGFNLTDVTFDSGGLQPGEYIGGLNIISNDPYQTFLSIPVTMTVLPTADMGEVSGAVSDAWTGEPLSAKVELEGVYTAEADPDYSIWAVEGSYTLTAYTTGYYTITLPVEIIAGETTEQDISLEPALPRMGELPSQISMSLPQGSTSTQTLELANNGPMPLEFAYFEITPLKSLGSTNHMEGMKILYDQAHCQSDLYSYSYLVSDLNAAGATIDTNYDPFDEFTLEGYDILWLNDGWCAWTFGELQILDEWLANGGSIFIQSENTPAASMPASIFGITYQSGTCVSGTTTNIYQHPITEGVDEFYIEWTCGYITGSPEAIIKDQSMQTHVIAAEQGRGKMVVVADNDFYNGIIYNNDNRLVAMNAFQWLAIPVYGEIPWLSETPQEGSIPYHSSLETTLGFDASALTPGVYEGILAIEHNDPNQNSPLTIPVQLTVTAEVPPESVTISGPDAGLAGESLLFAAQVEPAYTALPLSYLWEADGQLPITHTGGLTDTVSFTWDITGTITITVTAANEFGSVSGTSTITITRASYPTYLPLTQKDKVGGLASSPQVEIDRGNSRHSLTSLSELRRR